MPMSVTHEILTKVIDWAADAAREYVSLAKHRGEDLHTSLDTQYGMGLWQSFQVTFPKYSFQGKLLYPPGQYDLLVTALGATYRATVTTAIAMQEKT